MGSNLANRRLLGLGNWNLPVRRTLGNWQQDVFTLNSADVAAFLARNPAVKSKIELFQSQVLSRGYIQGREGYAISEWGIAVADPEFLNVTIFPDAVGQLVFTGNVPNHVAAEINKQRYVSPVGDEADPLMGLLKAALWIGGGLLAVSMFNTVRGK